MSTNITRTAKRLGVHRSTLQAWRKEGLDITSEAALQDRLAAARKSPDESQDVDGETYQAARRRREIANANRAETIAARERGELVEAAGIWLQGEAIGRTFRFALDKLAHDLPPLIAGYDAAKIESILRKHHRELLENLSHAHPKTYLGKV